jgi:hypothetical protein
LTPLSVNFQKGSWHGENSTSAEALPIKSKIKMAKKHHHQAPQTPMFVCLSRKFNIYDKLQRSLPNLNIKKWLRAHGIWALATTHNFQATTQIKKTMLQRKLLCQQHRMLLHLSPNKNLKA